MYQARRNSLLSESLSNLFQTPPPAFQLDHLSSLSDDCLRDVLERLDYNDLDQIAPFGQRLNKLVELTRPKAAKTKVSKLVVHHKTDSDMLGVIIKLASEEKFEINSLDGLTDDPGKQLLFKEFVAVDDVKRKRLEMADASIHKTFLDKASILLRRFDIVNCYFVSITFNEQFLALIKQVTSSKSIAKIYFDECNFENGSAIEERKRLLSIVIAAKPTSIDVNFITDLIFVDEDFIIDYANSVLHPNLKISGTIHPLPLSAALAAALWRFDSLDITRPISNTENMISIIVKRLHLKRTGVWNLNISESIDEVQIDSMLLEHNELTHSDEFYGHVIVIAETMHNVVFTTSSDGHGSFDLNARFL
ncbi:hypothetical protein PRIPAC_85323 [Pristionchus pacificus]|uniref:Uncharacterized protein n=1 Tax=Pristionchus pacificus TaxID=54126 RepID=A0A2A6BN67_PRIPA|nr:hypothetical protein PRIPAC_85323 [Pristionchus pacificus]|eukprot:PDM67349.1 hypothetical protein PRIPAC_48766 [Pristionchus pacificus]